jgi:hypothetical protein
MFSFYALLLRQLFSSWSLTAIAASSAPDLARRPKFERHRAWLVLGCRRAGEVLRALSAFIVLVCEWHTQAERASKAKKYKEHGHKERVKRARGEG